jgi:hypothetical protein
MVARTELIAGDLRFLSTRECEKMTGEIKSIQRLLDGLMRNLP